MKLNGWQRLWVVVSVLLVLPIALFTVQLCPKRDPNILRDLVAPECNVLRTLPPGFVPLTYPRNDDPCRALETFLYLERVDVRSVTDYERYLSTGKWKAFGIGLTTWIVLCGLIYSAGWSVAWIKRGFRQT